MNRLTVIGNLTKEPTLRTTQTGKTVCSFTVAVNRRKTQNGQQEVDYFNVSAWDKLAENCNKFLDKGRKVAVVGSVSARAYEGNDGSPRAQMEITANEVEFLSGRNDDSGDGYSNTSTSSYQNAPSREYDDEEAGYKPVASDDLPF